MTEKSSPQPAHEAYQIQTLTDMLKVPAERRAAMFRELELALLTHEFAFGEDAEKAMCTMTWTDDGDRTVDISANGKPLLTLKVEKKSEAIPAPEGAQAQWNDDRMVELRMLRQRVAMQRYELARLKGPNGKGAPAPQALPATLTDEMRAVLTNEKCVYGSADELYAALLAAAPQTKEPKA